MNPTKNLKALLFDELGNQKRQYLMSWEWHYFSDKVDL